MSEPTIHYVSLTVNIVNKTSQGPVTFNTLSFLNPKADDYSDVKPTRMTPAVANIVEANNESVRLLYVRGMYYFAYTNYGSPIKYTFSATGSAEFNLPNGDLLTIKWELEDFNDPNPTPTIVPASNAYAFGTSITTPTSSDGYNFVFDVILQEA